MFYIVVLILVKKTQSYFQVAGLGYKHNHYHISETKKPTSVKPDTKVSHNI